MSLIREYRKKFEKSIVPLLGRMGAQTPFLKACQYALESGGKRIRPFLTHAVAKSLGKGFDITESALSVELFHTASLVGDDLPCMDDADERRSKPSVHKAFGEEVALLVSYALIGEGYQCIYHNVNEIKKLSSVDAAYADHMGTVALDCAAKNTGIHGATGGQFLDVFEKNFTEDSFREVIHKKTTSLFELALVNGWIFGGGDLDRLQDVKKMASHFGVAFQVADDLGDMEEDARIGKQANWANLFGIESAKAVINEELCSFQEMAELLGISSPALQEASNLITDSMRDNALIIN